MSSWVKVSRKLLTSAIASKPEYLAVWVHLILSASYKAGEIMVGHQIVRLEPGQLVFGRVKFSQQIGVSEQVLRSALKALENLQQITIKSHSKYSIISITNWSKYQTEQPENNQRITGNQPAVNHNKEIQELQEEDQRHMSSQDDDGASPKRVRHKDDTPYMDFMKTYQEICAGKLKPAEVLNDPRKTAIRRAWNYKVRGAYPFRSEGFLEKYLSKCIQDSFMTGGGARGWKADLLHVFKEKTMNDVIGV